MKGEEQCRFPTIGDGSPGNILVAYSTQAPHSYAVIGKADWTMKFIGSVSSGPVWNKGSESIVNASQFVEDGFPLSGAAAGIEVNGPTGLELYGRKNGK